MVSRENGSSVSCRPNGKADGRHRKVRPFESGRSADRGQHVRHLRQVQHLFDGDLRQTPLPAAHHACLGFGEPALAHIVLQ
jgi:hypothetical protein